jgi:hypothetical protein
MVDLPLPATNERALLRSLPPTLQCVVTLLSASRLDMFRGGQTDILHPWQAAAYRDTAGLL